MLGCKSKKKISLWWKEVAVEKSELLAPSLSSLFVLLLVFLLCPNFTSLKDFREPVYRHILGA